MQALRNTIHIMLVLAVLSTGLPLYHPGDANRDGEVGLADAILRMQGFVEHTENTTDFRSGMADVLLTISSVAGFKKVIKSDREAANQPDSAKLPVGTVSSGPQLVRSWVMAMTLTGRSAIPSSPCLAPLLPPPKSLNA